MREPPPTATHSVVEHYERTSPSRDAPPLLAGTHISVPILPAKSGNGAGAAIAAVPDIERPRVDVGGRLAGMRYRGAGEASVPHTQLSVTASLLSTGVPIAETVAQVLEATRVAAGVEGADWDW